MPASAHFLPLRSFCLLRTLVQKRHESWSPFPALMVRLSGSAMCHRLRPAEGVSKTMGGDVGTPLLPRRSERLAKKSVTDDFCQDAPVMKRTRRMSSCRSAFWAIGGDVFSRIAQYVGWTLFRTVCRAAHAVADARMERVRFHPLTPRAVLTSVVGKLCHLHSLDLTGVHCVDDELLGAIVSAHRGLRKLAVAYCPRLTEAVLSRIPENVELDLRGCWRLLRPGPCLPSEAVIEAQLLALQHSDPNCHDGVSKFFEFASPASKATTDPAGYLFVVQTRYQPIVGCRTFTVRQLRYEDEARVCFLVRVESKDREMHDYIWLLWRDEPRGCWLTDAVLLADHGLLSFLHLIAPPVCEARRGDQGDVAGVGSRGSGLA